MNDKCERLESLFEKHPALKGKFLGFKYSRGGMGVSRTDNDWFECDDYYIAADDLAEFLADFEAMRDFILSKTECGAFCKSSAHLCHSCLPDGKHFKPKWEKSENTTISEE